MKNIEKTLNEELRNNNCIENLVNAIDSKKSIYDAFVVDGKLVIVFNDELETNEVEQIQTMINKMDGCGEVFSDEFELGYKGNFKSLTLDLLTDNVSIGKFEKGGEMAKSIMYSIELDTNDLEDKSFQEYLKSNSITYKVISKAKGTSAYTQEDSVKYIGKKEALMSMIDNHFAGDKQQSIKLYKEIKKMAKGGQVNKISTANQVKRNLRGSGSLTLELEMAVYVPSTTFADQIISKTLFQKRIQEVEKYLSKLFGGYSSTSVEGGYVSKEKGLIKEDVAKVVAFGTEESLKKSFKPLMRQISKWCESWGQESMGFEFEGDLYYVEKNAKFSKGGKIDKKPKFVKNAKK